MHRSKPLEALHFHGDLFRHIRSARKAQSIVSSPSSGLWVSDLDVVPSATSSCVRQTRYRRMEKAAQHPVHLDGRPHNAVSDRVNRLHVSHDGLTMQRQRHRDSFRFVQDWAGQRQELTALLPPRRRRICAAPPEHADVADCSPRRNRNYTLTPHPRASTSSASSAARALRTAAALRCSSPRASHRRER